jgi:hypothetical protein
MYCLIPERPEVLINRNNARVLRKAGQTSRQQTANHGIAEPSLEPSLQ